MSSRNPPFLQVIVCLLFGFAWATPVWAGDSSDAVDKADSDTVTSAPQENLVAQSASSPPESEPTARRKKPRIVVVGVALDASSERAAARLFQLGEMSAEDAGRFEFIDSTAFLDPETNSQEKSLLKQVRALLEESRAAYDELELGVSKKKAQEALEVVQKTDLSKNFDFYVDAQMLQIAALLADAETKEANQILNSLLPMDLQTPFDPDLFSPDYVVQVKEARSALKKDMPKGLDLKVQPIPAQVYIDGQFRGISSLELHDLVPGDHMVTLIAPGYRRLQRVMSPGTASAVVEKLEPTALNEKYQPLLQSLRKNFLNDDRSKVALEIAKFFDADQIVMLGIRSQGAGSFRTIGIRMDVTDGHEYAYLDEPFPNDEKQFEVASNDFFGKMFSMDLPRGKSGKAVQAQVNPFEWKMRHTSYVLFGVAAAAIGSGITFGVNAHHQSNTYASLDAPQTNPVYDRIETVGKRSAILSDVSFGVALAAAVTGTVFLIKDLIKKDSFGGQIDERGNMSRTAFNPIVESEEIPASPSSNGRVPFDDEQSNRGDTSDDEGKEGTGHSDDGWGDGW